MPGYSDTGKKRETNPDNEGSSRGATLRANLYSCSETHIQNTSERGQLTQRLDSIADQARKALRDTSGTSLMEERTGDPSPLDIHEDILINNPPKGSIHEQVKQTQERAPSTLYRQAYDTLSGEKKLQFWYERSNHIKNRLKEVKNALIGLKNINDSNLEAVKDIFEDLNTIQPKYSKFYTELIEACKVLDNHAQGHTNEEQVLPAAGVLISALTTEAITRNLPKMSQQEIIDDSYGELTEPLDSSDHPYPSLGEDLQSSILTATEPLSLATLRQYAQYFKWDNTTRVDRQQAFVTRPNESPSFHNTVEDITHTHSDLGSYPNSESVSLSAEKRHNKGNRVLGDTPVSQTDASTSNNSSNKRARIDVSDLSQTEPLIKRVRGDSEVDTSFDKILSSLQPDIINSVRNTIRSFKSGRTTIIKEEIHDIESIEEATSTILDLKRRQAIQSEESYKIIISEIDRSAIKTLLTRIPEIQTNNLKKRNKLLDKFLKEAADIKDSIPI